MNNIPKTTKRRKKIVSDGHTDDVSPRQQLGKGVCSAADDDAAQVITCTSPTSSSIKSTPEAPAIFVQRRCPSAAILGENSEQGEQLRQLTRCAFRKGHEALSCIPIVSDGEIATMTNAQKYGIGVDVLIRAAGGVDWPLSKQVLPQASLSLDQVVVMDIKSRRNRRARRTAQRLRRANHERGWNVFDSS